ncbi:MAG: cupin domain-containing protein [Beijerinckiaceae bacterium]
MQSAKETYRLANDGKIPNNPKLPLVIYRRAIAPIGDLARRFEERFAANGWTNSWRNGIFDFHHFHSNTHEVLGIAAGEAHVRFGGETGELVSLAAGDVVILPAGTGHKRDWASGDFLVVGAYPDGRDFDIRRGDPAEHAEVLSNIAQVPLPKRDPVSAGEGVASWPAR